MSIRRALTTVIVASAMMLAVGAGASVSGKAAASPRAQGTDSSTVPIPYSGRLTNEAGQPVTNGAYDFTFALYAAESGGERLWTETQEGVAVQGGAFTVLLGRVAPLPQEGLAGGAGWLEVGVRGPGEGEFTRLSPRQKLSAAASVAPAGAAAPTSGLSCAHTHWGEAWSGSGPYYGLTLYSNSDTFAALRASDTSSNGGFGVFADSHHGTGVYGYAFASSGTNYGVYGESRSSGGYGVYGTAQAYGVYGYATGTSGANYGVYGKSNSIHGRGVVGSAVATSGPNYGVMGYSSSPDGIGVYGQGYSGGYGGYFVGKVRVTGLLEKPGGGFKIDHPLDPANKYLNHSFVESPDMMNIYNGNVTLDENGEAWVQLPEWFEALNRDFRYQLTAIGAPMPNLYIAQKIQGNRFKIAGGIPGMEVSWQVTGIRHDPWANDHRISVEEDKSPDERGKYLHPESYGLPDTMGVDYARMPQFEEEVRR